MGWYCNQIAKTRKRQDQERKQSYFKTCNTFPTTTLPPPLPPKKKVPPPGHPTPTEHYSVNKPSPFFSLSGGAYVGCTLEEILWSLFRYKLFIRVYTRFCLSSHLFQYLLDWIFYLITLPFRFVAIVIRGKAIKNSFKKVRTTNRTKLLKTLMHAAEFTPSRGRVLIFTPSDPILFL